jgi:hypothetical protein
VTVPGSRLVASASAGRQATLLLLVTLLAASTATTFAAAPRARQAERRQQALAEVLLQRGITHIDTDYWPCDCLAFRTRERLICAVVGDDPRPGLDRYRPYRALVEADPTPPGAAARLPPGRSPPMRATPSLPAGVRRRRRAARLVGCVNAFMQLAGLVKRPPSRSCRRTLPG